MEKQLEIHIEFPLFYFYMYNDYEFTTAFRHVSGHNEIRKLNQIERLVSSIEFKYEAKKKKLSLPLSELKNKYNLHVADP